MESLKISNWAINSCYYFPWHRWFLVNSLNDGNVNCKNKKAPYLEHMQYNDTYVRDTCMSTFCILFASRTTHFFLSLYKSLPLCGVKHLTLSSLLTKCYQRPTFVCVATVHDTLHQIYVILLNRIGVCDNMELSYICILIRWKFYYSRVRLLD